MSYVHTNRSTVEDFLDCNLCAPSYVLSEWESDRAKERGVKYMEKEKEIAHYNWTMFQEFEAMNERTNGSKWKEIIMCDSDVDMHSFVLNVCNNLALIHSLALILQMQLHASIVSHFNSTLSNYSESMKR